MGNTQVTRNVTEEGRIQVNIRWDLNASSARNPNRREQRQQEQNEMQHQTVPERPHDDPQQQRRQQEVAQRRAHNQASFDDFDFVRRMYVQQEQVAAPRQQQQGQAFDGGNQIPQDAQASLLRLHMWRRQTELRRRQQQQARQQQQQQARRQEAVDFRLQLEQLNDDADKIWMLTADILKVGIFPCDPLQLIYDFAGITVAQKASKVQRYFGRNDDNSTYLKMRLIPIKTWKPKHVHVEVVSKDQGWTSDPTLERGQRTSHTYVYLKTGGVEERVVQNICAGQVFETTQRDWNEKDELLQALQNNLESGETSLNLTTVSRYPGWRCLVSRAEISLEWGLDVHGVEQALSKILKIH